MCGLGLLFFYTPLLDGFKMMVSPYDKLVIKQNVKDSVGCGTLPMSSQNNRLTAEACRKVADHNRARINEAPDLGVDYES